MNSPHGDNVYPAHLELEPTNPQDACDHGFPPPRRASSASRPTPTWSSLLGTVTEDGELPDDGNDCGVGA